MASTKPIAAKYSKRLNSMTNFICHYLAVNSDQAGQARTIKGIEDFCLNNSEEFKNTFYQKIGLDRKVNSNYKSEEAQTDHYKAFLTYLEELDGECIFLLKDTQQIFDDYQSATGKGFAVPINRKFLCKSNEEKYFELIELIYDSLEDANNTEDFIANYLTKFSELINRDKHFKNVAEKIARYVLLHCDNKIFWVDYGFQFTFSLFCYGAIERFGEGKIKQDFSNFTTYPWLQKLFSGKYFSERNELALNYELAGIESYYSKLKERSAGVITGFAIGDSLGFPIAGIERNDLIQMIELPVTNFTTNPYHPYFGHLRSGRFTDNTNTLVLSANHIIDKNGFNIEAYCNDLVRWYLGLEIHRVSQRWAGPTAITAIKKLSDGASYLTSGSTTTKSCSSTYRVIPLGVFYRPFIFDDWQDLCAKAMTSGAITHNSPLSIAGAAIVALIIADLFSGVMPEQAVRFALKAINKTADNTLLFETIEKAVEMSRKNTPDKDARKYLGTGSPIYQTLPLAIFYFLKYQNDFEKAVLAAANSYREDSPGETERIKNYSWEEQLIVAEGGNADGIAGLTGAFIGARLGQKNIPEKFRKVEDFQNLIDIGVKLASL